MRIDVTQDDIDAGNRTSREACPIARAVRRQAGIYFIEVNPCTLRWLEGCKIKRRPLPDEAREFIRRFDACEGVKPFSFELNIPAPTKDVAP